MGMKFAGLNYSRGAYTLAESLVVLLVLCMLVAIFGPLVIQMTKKDADSKIIWRWENRAARPNTNVFFLPSDSDRSVMIGQPTKYRPLFMESPDRGRLIINTTQTMPMLNLKTNGTNLSNLYVDSSNIIFGNQNNIMNTSYSVGTSNTALGMHSLYSINGGGWSFADDPVVNPTYNPNPTNAAFASFCSDHPAACDPCRTNPEWCRTCRDVSGRSTGTSPSCPTTGSFGNTGVGRAAGYGTTSGSYNSYVGDDAGTWASTGNFNTFVGTQNWVSGRSALTGSYVTAIGLNTCSGSLAGTVMGGTNNVTCLGAKANIDFGGYGHTAGIHDVIIGDTTTRTHIAIPWSGDNVGGGTRANVGQVGGYPVGNTTAIFGGGRLILLDSSGLREYSDKRLKNIKGKNNDGLDKIKALKTYNYTMKTDKTKAPYVGVVAQELQQVIPNAVSMVKTGFLGIDKDYILSALVNSIKELSQKISNLLNPIVVLEKENAKLEAKNKALEARLIKLEARN